MDRIRRRSFLAVLGTLPVISDWMRVFGSTNVKSRPKVSTDEKWQARFLAVETLRMINTAEKWHFGDTKEYISLEHLHESKAYKKLMEVGRFKNVISKLPADGRLDLPGYDTFLETTADRSKYVARVSMSGPFGTFAFASDEIGAIYEGKPLDLSASAKGDIDALIGDKYHMGQPPTTEQSGIGPFAMISPTRIFNFLLASLPPANEDCVCCTCEFPCPCLRICSCLNTCPDNCPDGESYCCYNCGCLGCYSCIWCRFSRCSSVCPSDDCFSSCDTCATNGIDCMCLA